MRKLKIRILPNDGYNPKWYYKNSNNLVGKELIVIEYDDEPIFTDSYRYTDSLFISKSDCVVVNVL